MVAGRSRTSGFSLIELLFAVFILGTALIMVIAMFITMLNSSQKAVDLTAGAVVAEALLDQSAYQIGTDPNNNTSASTFWNTAYTTDTSYSKGSYSLNNQQFFYNLLVQDESGGTFPTLISPLGNNGAGSPLKRLDCNVWWWGSGTTTASGHAMGQMQVTISRLVWPTAPF